METLFVWEEEALLWFNSVLINVHSLYSEFNSVYLKSEFSISIAQYLKVITKQEVKRKTGCSIQPDEEELR